MLNTKNIYALHDTGAHVSMVSYDFVQRFFSDKLRSTTRKVKSALDPTPRLLCGDIDLVISYDSVPPFSHRFAVWQFDKNDCKFDSILGLDILPRLGLCPKISPKWPTPMFEGTLRDDATVIQPSSQRTPSRQEVTDQDLVLQQLSSEIQDNKLTTGSCTMPEAVLHLGLVDRSPIFVHQYPIAHHLLPVVTEFVEGLISQNKVEDSVSQSNAPLLVVPKDTVPKPTWRVCFDARRLNERLGEHSIQVPHIQRLLQKLRGGKYFAELDLKSAYLQLPVAPEDRQFLAFTHNGRKYQFTHSPFGLATLTGHFQATMNLLLGDLDFVVTYVDNIVVVSKSLSEHVTHLKVVIKRLTSVNITLNMEKVVVARSCIAILGYLVSVDGIAADPEKVQALSNWPFPISSDQVASFLGLFNFLRSHIKGAATLTKRLDESKFSNSIFKRMIGDPTILAEMRQEFNDVKSSLLKLSLLVYPNFELPFAVTTDASDRGIGAVLTQANVDDTAPDYTRIIALASRKLHSYELNYSTYKKELLAVVFALSKFEHYLLAAPRDFCIYTDHRALIYMLDKKEVHRTVSGWADIIQQFTFKVRHLPGKHNLVADALSRTDSSEEIITINVVNQHQTSEDDDHDVDSREYVVVDTDEENLVVKLKSSDKSHEPLLSRLDWVKVVSAEKKSPPQEEREVLIKKVHDAGHFGVEKIFKHLYHKLNLYWPRMRTDIDRLVSGCLQCLRWNVVRHGYHPLHSPLAPWPWNMVSIDLSTSFPKSSRGNTVLLIIIDHFTGFVILKPLQSKEASVVAAALYEVFCIFGFPSNLKSDEGTEFANAILKSLCDKLKILKSFSAPYSPYMNGKVERSVGTCTRTIRKLLQGANADWDLFAPAAALSYNSAISSTHNSAPFSLMFARSLIPLDYYAISDVLDNSSLSSQQSALKLWLDKQQDIINIIYPNIQKVVVDKLNVANQNFAQRKLVIPNNRSLPVGSLVMRKDLLRSNKSEPPYLGPLTVVGRLVNGTYTLRDSTNAIVDNVPLNHLKPISSLTDVSVEQDYRVEKILKHAGTPGNYQYLVKWWGFPSSANTWEPAKSFSDVTILNQYWKSVTPVKSRPKSRSKSISSQNSQ